MRGSCADGRALPLEIQRHDHHGSRTRLERFLAALPKSGAHPTPKVAPDCSELLNPAIEPSNFRDH
jgi:hypothetical protein